MVVAHWVPAKMTAVQAGEEAATTVLVIDEVLAGKVRPGKLKIGVVGYGQRYVWRSDGGDRFSEWGLGDFPGSVNDLTKPAIWFLGHYTVVSGSYTRDLVPRYVLPLSLKPFLVAIRKSPSKGLSPFLTSSDSMIAQRAIRYVGDFDSMSVPAPKAGATVLRQYQSKVERCCHSSVAAVRKAAMYALYRMQQSQSEAFLLKMANDKDIDVRSLAASILLRSKSKSIIAGLLKSRALRELNAGAVLNLSSGRPLNIAVPLLLGILESNEGLGYTNESCALRAKKRLLKLTGYGFPYSVSRSRELWSRVEALPSKALRLKKLRELQRPLEVKWKGSLLTVNGRIALDLTNQAAVPVTVDRKFYLTSYKGARSSGFSNGGPMRAVTIRPRETHRFITGIGGKFVAASVTKVAFGFLVVHAKSPNPWLGNVSVAVPATLPALGKWKEPDKHENDPPPAKPLQIEDLLGNPIRTSAYYSPTSRFDTATLTSYVDDSLGLTAFDAVTKARLWDTNRRNLSGYPNVLVRSGSVLLAKPDIGRIEMLQARTGKELWHMEGPGQPALNADANGSLITFRSAIGLFDNTGKPLWYFRPPGVLAKRQSRDYYYEESSGWVVAMSTKCIAVMSANPVTLTVLDRQSGKTLWSRTVGLPDYIYWGPSLLKLHGDFLYVNLPARRQWTPYSGTRYHQTDPDLACYRVSDGHLMWRNPLVSGNEVYVVGGTLVVITNFSDSIVGYDSLTGKKLWSREGSAMGSFAGYMIAQVGKGRNTFLVGLDPANGDSAWQCRMSRQVSAYPTKITLDGSLWMQEEETSTMWRIALPKDLSAPRAPTEDLKRGRISPRSN